MPALIYTCSTTCSLPVRFDVIAIIRPMELILSLSVDAHVARHLFGSSGAEYSTSAVPYLYLDRVIGPRGLLSQKARVVVTNSVRHVKEFDQIILIRRGIILEGGTYDEVMSQSNSELCKLMYGNAPIHTSPSIFC
jgi:ATP-binding cassette subfamily C (CFTR/MRP) protein 1